MSRPSASVIRSLTSPSRGSTASTAQSPIPAAAKENRSSLGGIILTRARLSGPRSDPYPGLPPTFTALRVVAARIVGLAEILEASKWAPPARLVQPARLKATADDARPSITSRREGAASAGNSVITSSPCGRPLVDLSQTPASRVNEATTRRQVQGSRVDLARRQFGTAASLPAPRKRRKASKERREFAWPPKF